MTRARSSSAWFETVGIFPFFFCHPPDHNQFSGVESADAVSGHRDLGLLVQQRYESLGRVVFRASTKSDFGPTQLFSHPIPHRYCSYFHQMRSRRYRRVHRVSAFLVLEQRISVARPFFSAKRGHTRVQNGLR